MSCQNISGICLFGILQGRVLEAEGRFQNWFVLYACLQNLRHTCMAIMIAAHQFNLHIDMALAKSTELADELRRVCRARMGEIAETEKPRGRVTRDAGIESQEIVVRAAAWHRQAVCTKYR